MSHLQTHLQFQKELWSLITTVIISMSAFNFALNHTAKVNPELFDMIVSSTKLERFAEALGYYSPVAVPENNVIFEDTTELYDILNNDTEGDYNTFQTVDNANQNGLWIQNNNQITNVTGDTNATITVNPLFTGTSTPPEWTDGIPTYGNISITPSANYQGPLTYTYEVCDTNPPTDPEAVCTTTTNTLRVQAVNDLPFVSNFNVTTAKNTTFNFNISQFNSNFTDPDKVFLDTNPTVDSNTSEGYALENITITQLPTHGNLYNGANLVLLNSTIPKNELAAISYVPNTDFVGSDNFKYRADDGFLPIEAAEVTSLQQQLTPQALSSNEATVGITIGNQNQTLRPQITLTTDTPNVEINKKVCVLATVTNPNNFDLQNVVVDLTTDATKAPFIDGSSEIISGGNGTIISQNSSTANFNITLLPANGTTIMQTCVLPKITDISFINGKTYVTGSSDISEDNVTIIPPVKNGLIRTGGHTGTIFSLTVLQGLITALALVYFKIRNINKHK